MSHADIFFGASSRSGSTASDSSCEPAPIPSSSCLEPTPILSSNSSSSSDGNVPSCGFVNSCYFVSLFINLPFYSMDNTLWPYPAILWGVLVDGSFHNEYNLVLENKWIRLKLHNLLIKARKFREMPLQM